jgi:hypothetical protein
LEKVNCQVEGLIKEILFGGGKRDSQLYDWKAWLSEVIVEVFIVGKPDNPENWSTGGERSNLENIETIFIALQLHWSNGYCISSSSLDDG